MLIRVFNSNSEGNLILLELKKYRFALDMGYNFDLFKNINWKKINYILLSHEHGDHIAYLDKFRKRNRNFELIYPFALKNYLKEKEIYINDFSFNKDFNVYNFDIKHDCIANNAYIIHFKDKELESDSFAYLTDADNIPQTFIETIIKLKIKNIIIECNHDLNMINSFFEKAKKDNDVAAQLRINRVMNTHLNDMQIREFLKLINNEKRNVLLTHISKMNTNDKTFSFINNYKNLNISLAKKNLILDWS